MRDAKEAGEAVWDDVDRRYYLKVGAEIVWREVR